jgi:molybdopterin/thiamine biosynthesis adenylyltransferase
MTVFRPSDRVRIKPEHLPHKISADQIRLGGGVFGVASEIRGARQWVWDLLVSLNGEMSIAQVTQAMLNSYPEELSADTVMASVRRFAEAGHLEVMMEAPPDMLSDEQQERYSRSREFYRWIDPQFRRSSWDVQLALSAARITIVGIGGGGGTAAYALAASGVGNIHCVDCDTVELSNLNRQVLFTEDDIGRPKVDVAVDRLRAVNSDITVTGEVARMQSIDDLQCFSKQSDVLVLCADDPREIKVWTNRACIATRTPWIDGGYRGAQLTVAAYRPGDSACWECLRKSEGERPDLADIDKDYFGRNGGPRVPGHPATATSVGITGHLVAYAAMALITGAPDLPVGCVYGYNLVVPGHRKMSTYPRRLDCPACGVMEL